MTDSTDKSQRQNRRDRMRFSIPEGTVRFRKSLDGRVKRITCPLVNIGRGGLVYVSPVALAPRERVVVTVNVPRKTNYLKLISRCRWCVPIEGKDAFRVGVEFARYGAGIEKRLTSLEMRYGFLDSGDEEEAHGDGEQLDMETRAVSGDDPVGFYLVDDDSLAEDEPPRELPSDVPPEFAKIFEKFQDFDLDETTVQDILDVYEKGTDFDDLIKEEEADERVDVVRSLVPVYEMAESLPSAFDANGAPVDEPIAYAYLPNTRDSVQFSLRANRDALRGKGPPKFAEGDLLFFSKRKVRDLDHALIVIDGEAVFGQVFIEEDVMRVRPPNQDYPEMRIAMDDVTATWRMVVKIQQF